MAWTLMRTVRGLDGAEADEGTGPRPLTCVRPVRRGDQLGPEQEAVPPKIPWHPCSLRSGLATSKTPLAFGVTRRASNICIIAGY